MTDGARPRRALAAGATAGQMEAAEDAEAPLAALAELTERLEAWVSSQSAGADPRGASPSSPGGAREEENELFAAVLGM